MIDIRNQWYYSRTDPNKHFAMSNKRVQFMKPWKKSWSWKNIMHYHEKISSKSSHFIFDVPYIFIICHARESHFSLYVMQKRCHAIVFNVEKSFDNHAIAVHQWQCFSARFPTAFSIFQHAGTQVAIGIVQLSSIIIIVYRFISTQTLWLSIRLYLIRSCMPQCDQHMQFIYYSPHRS